MISFWNDYANLIMTWRFNWVSFHFLHFYFEWDKMANSLDLEVVVLGLGFRVSIPLKGTTPQKEEILKRCEEVESGKAVIYKRDDFCWHHDLRLGQALYNAVYTHLHKKGQPRPTDKEIGNFLFSASDKKLQQILRREAKRYNDIIREKKVSKLA